MEKHEIEEKLESGYMQCHITLEIMGHPKEHVEKTMQLVMERLNAEKGVEIISSNVHEARLQEKQQLFSTFAEVELLLRDLETLTRICFDYMPSSVELIKPDDFKLSALDMSNFVSDMLSTLHHIDFKLKDANAKNLLLEKNSANLLKNFVYFFKQILVEIIARATIQTSQRLFVPWNYLHGASVSRISLASKRTAGSIPDTCFPPP